MAADIILQLRTDIYMKSVDLRNNEINEHWCREFVKLLDNNKTLTSIDLRENEGFTTRIHRQLALGLMQNIQTLREKVQLDDGYQDLEDEHQSKFIKSNLLTVEVPRKLLKNFSQKLKKIKKLGRSSKLIKSK